MQKLKNEINNCLECPNLPLGPKPIFQINPKAKIIIIGQAPGVKAHESGIAWNDASGVRLREWCGLSKDEFYNEELIALLPMGLCYPGKGIKGDMPPRKECFPKWHERILNHLPCIELVVLVGQYSQNQYLKREKENTLTETVKSYHKYAPRFFPLPHPSPLNNIWLSKNKWFENEITPHLKVRIRELLDR